MSVTALYGDMADSLWRTFLCERSSRGKVCAYYQLYVPVAERFATCVLVTHLSAWWQLGAELLGALLPLSALVICKTICILQTCNHI